MAPAPLTKIDTNIESSGVRKGAEGAEAPPPPEMTDQKKIKIVSPYVLKILEKKINFLVEIFNLWLKSNFF